MAQHDQPTRYLADECVDARLVRALRAAGRDVSDAPVAEPALTDVQIAALAASENRIILTSDKDFAELAVRRQTPMAGLILIRTTAWRAAAQAILRLGDRAAGAPSVIRKDGSVRRRPLEQDRGDTR